jgi:DNA-binding NarL/FixJ family response regulator
MIPDGAPIRVFLADDSAAIRERVGAMLTAAGMRVGGAAGTPRACVAAILASRPDVVVLDVQLEGGTGLEVLKAVRAAAPEVAFVVFSNNSAPAYRTRYIGQGAAGFLDKTAEFDQLAGAVRSACGAPAPPRRPGA